MESQLRISVVIPAHNGAAMIAVGLEALQAQRALLHEIIVVDDYSSDGTAECAERLGAVVIRPPQHQHANACRNLGARHASGDVVLFLDHDVVVRPGTIAELHAAFADPGTDAVVGLYSVEHRNPNFASRFKNFWIRYSYLQSDGHIDWIFGAVSAIRRDLFHLAGGFDRLAMVTIGIDDLELGKRMVQREFRIRFNPRVEVEHLKSHTFAGLLRNDFDRSRAFVKLAGSLGQLGDSVSGGFVNIYPAFIRGTALSWPLLVAGCAAAGGALPLWPFLVLASAWIALGIPFLHAFRTHYGFIRTLGAAGTLLCIHLACTLGGAAGAAELIVRGRAFLSARRAIHGA